MRRSAPLTLVLIAVLGAVCAEAGLFQDIYRGLDLVATPSGSPLSTTGDGTRVNGARSGRLRIVPSGLGPGYELQFDRSFGADSRGRPETLHFFGFGDLTLQGSLQSTLGYSGKRFRTISGNFTANNLSYDLKSTLGVQDAELTGTLNVATNFDVNPLGFYTLTLNASNANSQFKLNGIVVQDTQTTNFDVGPINLKGNIFVDSLAGLLTSSGQDTSWLQGLTPQSPINLIGDAIRQNLQQNRVVAGETVQAELPALLLKTVLQGDAQAAQQLVAESALAASRSAGDGTGPPVTVPEPGTLLLVAAGAAVFWRVRRR